MTREAVCSSLLPRAALVAVLGVLSWLLPAGAQATPGSKFASFATPGCAGAPEWRIGYRFYFRDTAGRQLARDETTQEAASAAEEFAADVGELSTCGARVAIDLYDEGDGVWPAKGGGAAANDDQVAPTDAASFRAAGDYDHGFYRHPGSAGMECTGSTNFTDAEFPVISGRDCGGSFGTPWTMLLLHEWLHTVVAAHPQVDWPTEDVHGACAHGYTEGACLVNRRYFGDMMTGQVREAGRLTGIRKESWRKARYPAKLKVMRAEVRNSRLAVLFSITGRATGDLTVDYQAAGAFTRFTVDVGPAREGEKHVRLSEALTEPQRRRPTGIVNVSFAGNRLTLADALRLRAADGKSVLSPSTVTFAGRRLRVVGTLTHEVKGVVRLRVTYQKLDGAVAEWTGRAQVKAGKWALSEQLPADAATDPNAYLTMQFTGDLGARGGPYRGEQDGKGLGNL